jgi:hypothetical protein
MPTPAIHLRLPDDLRAAIIGEAYRDDRTILDMVRKLLKEALAARMADRDSAPLPGLTHVAERIIASRITAEPEPELVLQSFETEGMGEF